MNFLPPIPVILPLLVAAILTGTGTLIPRRVVDLTAILTSSAVIVVCLLLFLHAPVVYWFGNHMPKGNISLGISFVIDKTGALLASFAALLTTSAFIFSWKYFDAVKNLFHTLMLLFLAGMTGFCLTGDLFNLFIFFELMSVAAYSLTGYRNEGPAPLQGALNFAVTNSIGGSLILLGIAFIYSRTGALNLAQAGNFLSGQKMDALIAASFILIASGFFVKAALVPFHFASADAHTVGPTPILLLFSGIMSPLALYGIARVYWNVYSDISLPYINTFIYILFSLGVLTVIIGSIMCFNESSLKRMLAFSTISNMGIFIIGIAALNPDGLKAVVFYILIHGALKSSLFICTGVLFHRFGSIDETELAGKGKRTPVTGIIFTISALGLAGLPFFGTLTAKDMIEESVKSIGVSWIILLFLYESFLTGGAMLRAAGKIFLGWGIKRTGKSVSTQEDEGNENETRQGQDITPPVMLAPAILLLVFSVGIGIYLQLNNRIDLSINEFQSRDYYQSLVFNTALPDVPSVSKPFSFSWTSGILTFLGVLAVSLISLFKNIVPRFLRKTTAITITPVILQLKSLHSGFVGDYITWLLFGITVIASVFALNLI